MSAQPQRRTADPRHPWWCAAQFCEWDRDWSGDHRSRPYVVESTLPHGASTTLWISQWIYDELTTSPVWVNVRISETRADGTEVVSVQSYSFPASEAAEVGRLMSALAERGGERRYVADEVWRSGVTPPPEAPPGPGEAGNSGPGFGPLPGDLS
jgi:hypothetical protein